MTPQITADRWRQIEGLFHSTLECAPEERVDFLAHACGDDHELHAEVESLLTAHESDRDSFLDVPAYEVAPDFLADALGGLLVGQQIGPYKILSSLASGGMGEVYLAQDTRLGRKIALKLLPPDFAKDQHRIRRFAQEARAASALNHPNVCVIHEVGKTSDGRHFIAMELIDGITLRERIAQRPLSVEDALVVAEQIAAALVAAHSAGVIHRDIKPENIMLRTDGYVKVLDFGLAKLNESQTGSGTINEASTIAHVHTEPGTQMGTVRYMSPEHLRERPVDERADIWSFGVVLHEMVTGATPFEAHTRNEIVALILKRQAARLRFFDDVPHDFQQVVAKALNKNRAERYQTAVELAEDLRRLRRRLKGEASVEPLLAADQITVLRRSNGNLGESARRRRKIETHASSGTWASALTYISRTAENVLTGIKDHPRATIFSGAMALVALLFLIPNVPRLSNRLRTIINPSSPQQDVPSPTFKVTPLTNSGQSVCAAISPDGKSFAHVEKKDGMQEVQLMNISNAGASVVVPADDFNYRGVTFSPDGTYLYLTRSAGKSDRNSLFQVALPGGTPRKLLDRVDTPISFSPIGDRFAFVRVNQSGHEYSLVIAGVDGTGERTIATRPDKNTITIGPSWSPDGKTIVCAGAWWDTNHRANLVEVDVESGAEKTINTRQWYSIYQVAWFADKSGLIVSAKDEPLSPIQLWRVRYPDGQTVRITADTSEYEMVSVARDSPTIIAVQRTTKGEVWLMPNGNAEAARSVASTVGRLYGHALAWTNNGQIVLSSLAGKNLALWLIDPAGSRSTQLTSNQGDYYTPTTSPDGRFIVFASNRNGSGLNIWRMNAEDGSDVKQLTFTTGNSYPSVSPDSHWVVYDNQSDANSPVTAWKVPIDGGDPVPLTDQSARMPIVSPDGRFIACRQLGENGSREIVVLPFDGGSPIERLSIPVRDFQQIEWAPDGRALIYIDTIKGVSNLWSFDLATRATKQLTHSKSDQDQIFSYAWSRDRKQLACLRVNESRDVMTITNEK